MTKTCGNCAAMIDEGDGCPFCVWRDLYYFVKPEMLACEDWRSKDDKLRVGLAKYHADVKKKLKD